MVFSIRRVLGAVSLQMFDGLMSVRDGLLEGAGAWLYQLGSLYGALVVLLSIGMLVYWTACAGSILASVDDELTDEEFDRLQPGKRLRAYLAELALSLRWLAR